MNTPRWCPACDAWTRWPESHRHATMDAFAEGTPVSGVAWTGWEAVGYTRAYRVRGVIVDVRADSAVLSATVRDAEGREWGVVAEHVRPDTRAARRAAAVRALVSFAAQACAWA